MTEQDDGDDGIERNLGEQPLARLMAELELKPVDLVKASTDQLTFKMVSRACKGRRLTVNVQTKIRDAMCRASGKAYAFKDLFTY
jgi:hypothetical protein